MTTAPGTKVQHGSIWRRVAAEPLLHFLLLAAGLFLLQGFFAGDQRELILVDAVTQDYLIQQQEDLLLRPLTAAEKDEVIQNFVEEEILVREARARGYSDSSRIRTLLLQNMRFFLTSDLEAPGEKELQDFYRQHQQDFTSPPSLDVRHVFFPDPKSVPADTMQQLAAGVDPISLGAPAVMGQGSILRKLDQKRLVQAFGPDNARLILGTEDDTWLGPLSSPDGSVHFVQVIGRNPAITPSYEDARNWLEAEWLSRRSRELVEAELEAVAPGYRIEIETLDAHDES